MAQAPNTHMTHIISAALTAYFASRQITTEAGRAHVALVTYRSHSGIASHTPDDAAPGWKLSSAAVDREADHDPSPSPTSTVTSNYNQAQRRSPGWDCRLSPVSMTPGNTEMMSEFCWSRLKVVDVAPAVWMST